MNQTNHKSVDGGTPPTPLQNDIAIMQIYNVQYYTALITYNNRYYYYDMLGIAVPNTTSPIRDHLR